MKDQNEDHLDDLDDDPENLGLTGGLRSAASSSEERGTMGKMGHEVTSRKLNEYLFKMVRYRHMDFDLACFLMIKSITDPK